MVNLLLGPGHAGLLARKFFQVSGIRQQTLFLGLQFLLTRGQAVDVLFGPEFTLKSSQFEKAGMPHEKKVKR